MSYEECKKIYAEVVIFINKRLVRLVDVIVEQWLDLKYGNHKTMDENVNKGVIDYENKLKNEDDEPWSEDGVPYEMCDHICEPFRLKNRKANALWVSWMRGDDEEREEQHKKRGNLFDDTTRNLPIYEIRRFEMIKYSFGQEEEYVDIKEYEYDDLTRTNDDPCHAYREIFHNMDEGWLVTRAEIPEIGLHGFLIFCTGPRWKEIDNVGGVSIV
ncbi:hypothetical protein Tco_1275952 [Tanacetum coccineum]